MHRKTTCFRRTEKPVTLREHHLESKGMRKGEILFRHPKRLNNL